MVWPKNREIPLLYYCLFVLVESDALNVGTTDFIYSLRNKESSCLVSESSSKAVCSFLYSVYNLLISGLS